MPDGSLNPVKVAQATTIFAAVSPEQLRQNLKAFDGLIQAQNSTQSNDVAVETSTPATPVAKEYSDSLQSISSPLDPGFAQQPPPISGNFPVVVSGVLNGVPGSGQAFFQDYPAPI